MIGRRVALDRKLARIASIPIFAACRPETRVLLGRLCEEIRLPAGSVVEAEGGHGGCWLVIQSGTAVASKDGKLTALFGPGDNWGQVPILAGVPNGVSLHALTPMILYSFERPAFLGVLDEVPEVAMALLRDMATWTPPYSSMRLGTPHRVSG